jgi:predicted dehydrogenase
MRPVFDRTPWRYQEPNPKDFPIGSMCHPISLITYFFGDAEEVHAYGINSGVDPRYPAHRQDTYLALLKFQDGGIGRVLGAFGIVEPPLPMESLSLFGTKGSLVNNDVVLDRLPAHPVLHLGYRSEAGHGGQVQRYMAEFVRCVREGATSVPVHRAGRGQDGGDRRGNQGVGANGPAREASSGVLSNGPEAQAKGNGPKATSRRRRPKAAGEEMP